LKIATELAIRDSPPLFALRRHNRPTTSAASQWIASALLVR
jgi:hypothetical protein